MKLSWKKYFLFASVIIVGAGLLFVLVETVRAKNTGFEVKTLWDWMELFIVPIVLTGGALFLNRSERNTEREIATDRQQEAALQAYIGKISELLLEKKLRTTKRAEVRDVARTLTISVMRGLDTRRNNLVIQFLREANLINSPNSILNRASMGGINLKELKLHKVYLDGADLDGADLSGADLSGAHLVGACLIEANLLGAHLGRANLRGASLVVANMRYAELANANLKGAKLQFAQLNNAYLAHANLEGANMRYAELANANLTEANLKAVTYTTDEQLATVKSLTGATMPDGTKHE